MLYSKASNLGFEAAVDIKSVHGGKQTPQSSTLGVPRPGTRIMLGK
jgi:hypothetical protein